MDDKEKYLKDLYSDLKYSASKFDSQTLAISGGALTFSLTFVKEIVPFTESIHICLLYIALGLFIYTIAMGLVGHYLSIRQISISIEAVSQEKYGDLKPDAVIPKINASLIFSIVLGIIMLIAYCVLNIEHQKNENQEVKNSQQTIEIVKETDGGYLKIEGELNSFALKDSTVSKKTNIKIENHE